MKNELLEFLVLEIAKSNSYKKSRQKKLLPEEKASVK